MLKSACTSLAMLSLIAVVAGGCRYYAGGPDCRGEGCEMPCDDEGDLDDGGTDDDGTDGGEGEGEGEGEAPADRDGDGLSDEFEAGRGTDPDDADSDGDGDSDGDEVACESSPLDPFLRCPEAPADADSDGLSDEFEAGRGTDPASADSDGDGDDDGDEVACGSSPLDPHFTCANPPAPGENGGCP